MPAKSKAQQRFMAMAEHNPGALRGPVPDMTQQQMHDFAATPRKGLPAHVTKAATSSKPGHPHANLGKFLHPKKAR